MQQINQSKFTDLKDNIKGIVLSILTELIIIILQLTNVVKVRFIEAHAPHESHFIGLQIRNCTLEILSVIQYFRN